MTDNFRNPNPSVNDRLLALRKQMESLAELGVREHWPPDEWRAGILRVLLDGGQ